jgi:hypothetical protein
MVHPVVLGAGKSLFRTATGRFALKLVARTFESDSVLLCYRPAGSDRA